ncbi:extracellular solute-binding protein [Paenibacillus sepulcri]|uniref:Extracellular solute-binding protein n=1 Tax=Paenibacillus sepulcri TaxID=359917 RepID=A0ABS7C2C3_9BACL|nr:extracellular solute-binding protein [Paenibacillus sepulcri]
MTKILGLLLAAILVLSACSNSGAGTGGDTGGNTPASAEGRISLPAFTLQSSAIQDYDDNDLTKLIAEKFNVDIKWTLAPADAVLEKQNVLLASGNYPPIFFGGQFNQNDQIKYGQSGILLPLNKLIEQYGPNIQAAFEKSPYLLKGVTAPDGNIYALPGLEECYHCDYSQKMYINKEWLQKLNLQMPTTTDELYKVLKAFQEQDPNGNGLKDEIPLTGATKWWHGEPTYYLMNAFIYATDENFLTLNDGVVDISANKPEWKEGLACVKKLYQEGLIDPQAYTQNLEGLQKVADNPDTIILGAFTGGCCVPTITDDARWTQYEVVPPIKGPGGVQLTGYFGGSVGDAQFAVTNIASEEQQIAAIKIVDYFYSQEGALDSMYGPKDIGWFDAKPDEKGIDGNPAIYQGIEAYTRKDKRSVTWDNNLKYTPADLFNANVQGQDITKPDGFEKYLALQTDKLVPFKPKETFPQAIWYNPEEAQNIAQMKTDIMSYISTNALQFITGNKDLDKSWDDYVKGFDGLGLEKYIEANQKAYDEQYKS